jgi:hypothetical protein
MIGSMFLLIMHIFGYGFRMTDVTGQAKRVLGARRSTTIYY